jgi:copper chaperone CopZ
MKKTIKIQGMSCEHCVMHVKNELEAIPNARILNVKIGLAELEVDATTDNSTLVAAIKEAGYEVISIN